MASGFWVQGSGLGVQASEFRVQDSGFRAQGTGLRVADEALRKINGTSLSSTAKTKLKAERHFEEFNLRALDAVPVSKLAMRGGHLCTPVTGPRVSINGDPTYMFSDFHHWDRVPSEGIPM